jgi:hypothetical protein
MSRENIQRDGDQAGKAGWYSERDVTHQCATCYWVLKEHRLACCEFDLGAFPAATKCAKFALEGMNP